MNSQFTKITDQNNELKSWLIQRLHYDVLNANISDTFSNCIDVKLNEREINIRVQMALKLYNYNTADSSLE